MKLIDKDALVAEIERWLGETDKGFPNDHNLGRYDMCKQMLSIIDTLEVKELVPIAYVVTRCEEHSDYIEEVFFDEDKAQEYCEQFKGNENEYSRHVTKIEVTL